MTREEEIEDALNFYAPSFRADTRTVMTDRELGISFEGFRRGAKWADEHPSRWISVEDDLPILNKEVIVLRYRLDTTPNTAPIYGISFGHIVDKAIYQDYDGWNVPGVAYWMPMPKLPKE